MGWGCYPSVLYYLWERGILSRFGEGEQVGLFHENYVACLHVYTIFAGKPLAKILCKQWNRKTCLQTTCSQMFNTPPSLYLFSLIKLKVILSKQF